MKKPNTKYTVTIAWGYEREIKKYSFDTAAERAAFLRGVDESNGWMDYATVKQEDPK